MKRLWIVAALFAVAVINGCGGGSSGYVGTPGSREVIVFERQQAIYAMSPDGSNVRFVTNGRLPAISPVGGRIAFVDSVVGPPFNQIFTCNLDGSGRKQLTTSGGISPAWSPDGNQIVYQISTGVNFVGGIAIINADGTENRTLTSQEGHEYPEFTPDGQRVSFASGRLASVVSVNLHGEDERAVARNGYLGHDWSPNGYSVVYSDGEGSKYGATYDIYLKKLGVSAPIKLTEGGSFKAQPSFSPDGRKVVYTDNVGSVTVIGAPGSVTARNLYILDLETKEVQKITTDNMSEDPDWGRF